MEDIHPHKVKVQVTLTSYGRDAFSLDRSWT